MRKSIAIIIIILVVGAAGVVRYWGTIRPAASNAIKNFQKNNLGVLVDEIKRDIFAPSPLFVGGTHNNVVLSAATIMLETNKARAENGGLPALVENTTLNAVAKAKAEDMFKKEYFEHVSPSGVGPGDLVKRYGYDYLLTGENLILGNFADEHEVVEKWMNSPGHRANILHTRFTEIGVAVVRGMYKGETVWIGVQEFGLPLSACPQADARLKTRIEANQKALETLDAALEAKKQQIDATNKKSSQYNQLVDEYNAMVGQYNAVNNETKTLITRYNAQWDAFEKCAAQ